MKRYFLHYFNSIIAGLFLGIILGILFFGVGDSVSSNLSAKFIADNNLSIPYDKQTANLTVNIRGQDQDNVSETSTQEGANKIVAILTTIFYYMKILLGILAVFWIVMAGVYIVSNSRTEDEVTKGKHMATYAIIGLGAILLVEPIVLDIIYGGGDVSAIKEIDQTKYMQSASNLRIQVAGFIAFGKTLIVFIAMAYMMLAGGKMILAWGEEEQITSAKQLFWPIVVGVLVILFNEVFIDTILYQTSFFKGDEKVQFIADSSNASNFVLQLIGFLQYVFAFLALLALGFIIYGGFLYISSFGEDEAAEKGKKVIIRTAIGIVILLLSYTVMMSLVGFQL